MIIEIDGLSVHLYRKRIKNINLRINMAGDVKVSAPMRLPLYIIHEFLQVKRDWIQERRQQLIAKSKPVPQFMHGEQHFFLGKSYQLKIHENAQRDQIIIDGDWMNCHLKQRHELSHSQKILQTFYKQEMHLLLPALILKWEAVIGVRIDSWCTKMMKTRWGSCNPIKKRICLNIRLMQKPLICLEYVIVHELIHLLEANHGPRFYALMSQFMPEWRHYQKQLEDKNIQ